MAAFTPRDRLSMRASLCLLVAFSGLLASLSWGASSFGFWEAFLGWPAGDLDKQRLWETIVWHIRLPRLLIAALCGASLAAAGVLSQGLFRNALASPSILGVCGAGVLVTVACHALGFALLPGLGMAGYAFLGSLVSLGLLMLISRFRQGWGSDQLLLTGLALSSVWGALSSLVLSLSLPEPNKVAAIMHWMLGGFNGLGWPQLASCSLPLLCGLGAGWFLAPALNILAFGEETAQTLSLNVQRLKQKLLVIIALLVACTVSVAGALPFVSLVVPHVTRLIIGPEHRRLLLFSALNGASLTLWADLLARTVKAPLEIEVGVITALLGAPFFLFMLFSGRSKL